MGQPKALLPVRPGGPTFVRHLSAALLEGGVADVLVVGRPDDVALRTEVESWEHTSGSSPTPTPRQVSSPR